jgi:putative membrane protein
MKKNIISQIVNFKVLLILLFSITVVSCSNSQKGEDTKEIADEHNDAKFEDNDKEKDAQFLVNAAEINLEEISLGQLAQKNGNTADLKELGKMMEAGHTKSLTELTLLAKEKLITIPTSSTE